MIRRTEGSPPFVIDRRLPRPIFERAPGVRELVCNPSDDDPMRFGSMDEAEAALYESVSGEHLKAYEWSIEPENHSSRLRGGT